MEVEAGLADPDDLRPSGKGDQLICGEPLMILGFVRMGAYGRPNVSLGNCKGVHRLEAVEAIANGQHETNPRGASPFDHQTPVLVELGRVQVDVTVDQHGCRLANRLEPRKCREE